MSEYFTPDENFDPGTEDYIIDFWIKNEGAIKKFKDIEQFKKMKGVRELDELSVPKDGWYHIALVKNDPSEYGVYVDGICINMNGKKVWKGIIQLHFRSLACKSKIIEFFYNRIYPNMYCNEVG
jgi:hypothetical protein